MPVSVEVPTQSVFLYEVQTMWRFIMAGGVAGAAVGSGRVMENMGAIVGFQEVSIFATLVIAGGKVSYNLAQSAV